LDIRLDAQSLCRDRAQFQALLFFLWRARVAATTCLRQRRPVEGPEQALNAATLSDGVVFDLLEALRIPCNEAFQVLEKLLYKLLQLLGGERHRQTLR